MRFSVPGAVTRRWKGYVTVPRKRALFLFLGLLGVGASAAGAWSPALGVVGAVVAACVLVQQHRDVGAMVIDFTEADWTSEPNADGLLVLTVPFQQHGLPSPSVGVWVRNDQGHWEPFLDQWIPGEDDLHTLRRPEVHTDDAGVIRVRFPLAFAGQLRIA
jgi:hypothetical protein